MDVAKLIDAGQATLGIELGSTRIKSVLIDQNGTLLFCGSYTWENRWEKGIWTYRMEDVITGLQSSYADLARQVRESCGVTLRSLRAIGISGMMHGYLPFDGAGGLLTPFRTWRNTMTAQASHVLGQRFHFHIPQRWSIAHLGQAMLAREAHVESIRSLTTLAGYVHRLLSGEFVIGICEASGMFPVDPKTKTYDAAMVAAFEDFAKENGYGIDLKSMLPRVLRAGEPAGVLSEAGAALLDPTGNLLAGIPMCPPEGDGGTGMVATNSVRPGTGNVSAGTSIFGMAVLDQPLRGVYEELDVLSTPAGSPVVMVHCNNGTGEIDAWVSCFEQLSHACGISLTKTQIYDALYHAALEPSAGDMVVYNYLSGEHMTNVEQGVPLLMRAPGAVLDLPGFARALLYSTLATLRMGMDLLREQEAVRLTSMSAHGGLYKIPAVGQKITAAALRSPVTVMETAGEGGAWGMALLALYMADRGENESLEEYLETRIFATCRKRVEAVDDALADDFDRYMTAFRQGLATERGAIAAFSLGKEPSKT
ncbi:MAG: ATPase [Clostridia bacterium]|nr:ATPase [Clostridia bacterium]